MTRDQIIAKWETLTPRERDAWVVEVVFEYTVWYEKHIGGDIFIVPNGVRMTLPRYTEDIAAAWAILDAFTDYSCCLDYSSIATSVSLWSGVIYEGRSEATRSTAPEAICLAAIIAKLSPAE